MGYLQCVRVSACAAVRSTGGSQWKKWCAKEKRGWGNDHVQDSTEMYREWIMSQRIHLSIKHIKVHFSNGVFTKWALAVFNSPGSLLCRKHLALKKKANIVFSSLFASNRVSFPPTLSFICLHCPSLSSLCVSAKKWWMEKYILEQVWIQTGYNYLCSTFSREAKSSVSDKSGRTYLSNWLLIFSSGLHMMHVLATQKLLNSHLGLTRGITKSKTAELCVFVYAWHLAATVACNCFKAKRNKCSTCNFRIWIQQRQSWFCACKYMQMNSLSEIHIHAQAIKCTSSI